VWCGVELTGEAEGLGGNPVPMSLCPPQILTYWQGIVPVPHGSCQLCLCNKVSPCAVCRLDNCACRWRRRKAGGFCGPWILSDVTACNAVHFVVPGYCQMLRHVMLCTLSSLDIVRCYGM
jgi:hypothetical protein